MPFGFGMDKRVPLSEAKRRFKRLERDTKLDLAIAAEERYQFELADKYLAEAEQLERDSYA